MFDIFWWTYLGNVPLFRNPHGIKIFLRHVQLTCLGKVKRLIEPRNYEIYFQDKFVEHVWEKYIHWPEALNS